MAMHNGSRWDSAAVTDVTLSPIGGQESSSRGNARIAPVSELFPAQNTFIVQHEIEVNRQQHQLLGTSLQQRLTTLELAERSHMKREQQLAIREAAMERVLSVRPAGPMRDWERLVDSYIKEAVRRLSPPQVEGVAVVARELEDRAVELECLIHQWTMHLADSRHKEELLRSREAKVRASELEIQVSKANIATSWQELADRERKLREREVEVDGFREHCAEWAKRLQRKEDEMNARIIPEQPSTSLTSSQRQTETTFDKRERVTSSLSTPPLDKESIAFAQEQLVEVSRYLRTQFDVLESGRNWVHTRATALHEAMSQWEAASRRGGDHLHFKHAPPPLPVVAEETRSFLAAFESLSASPPVVGSVEHHSRVDLQAMRPARPPPPPSASPVWEWGDRDVDVVSVVSSELVLQ